MSCCGTKIQARRNGDLRITYTPDSRNFTFSGMVPTISIRLDDVVLLTVTDAATVNGSSFIVTGDSFVLTITKEDLALLDSAAPDTEKETLSYDVVVTDLTGFESWLLGGPFVLLGLNDQSCGSTSGDVEVSLNGQCVDVTIEGGNIGAVAAVALGELNQAVSDAEAAAAAAEAARDSTISGLASKASKDGSDITSGSDWRSALGLGDSSTLNVGIIAGTVAAGDDARLVAVAGKADTDGGNVLSSFVEAQPFEPSPGITDWTVADDLRQSVYLARWKNAGNTWADAFDAAFVYLNSIGGGELIVPRGDLALPRTVVVPYGRINITGNGQGSTVFKVNFSGDVFRFKAPSGFYLASSIRYCSVDYIGGSAAASGYAVVFDGVGDCRAVSVGFNKTWRGFGFEGNNRNCRVIDCGGSDPVDAEFVVNGGGNQYVQLGTTFDNLTSTTSRSVRVNATERVDLDFFTSSHHGTALEIKPATGGFVQNVFANFNDLDAANGVSVIVDPTNANTVIRNLFFRGGSMSAATEIGLHVKSGAGQVGDIWLNGVMIQSNIKEGCVFEKGRIHLTDCLVARNGSNAGEPGVRLKSGVTSFQMVGGAVGPILGGPDTSARPMSLENFQLYGIVIDSGFAGTCSLDAVDLRGNVTGAVQNNSTAVVAARNCPGVGQRLIASGTDVLAAGTAVKAVSPPLLGYAITGSTSIIITPLGGGPSTKGAITSLAVGGTTSTSFDVISDPFVNLTNSLAFSWAIYGDN